MFKLRVLYFRPPAQIKLLKAERDTMILSIDGMMAGECVYARTPTAEYWMILLGHLIATVYRKGNGAEVKGIGDRKLSNRITQGEPFKMFDKNNDPVSVIQVLEVKRVKSDTIPFSK